MVPPKLSVAELTVRELSATELADYPPEGRALATQNLALLQQLPFPYLVVLLRELNGFDWKLPAERRRLTGQMAALGGFDVGRRAEVLRGFAALTISDSLLQTHWATAPAATLEQLTAWLWSSHQMDAFRQAADGFAVAMETAVPAASGGQARLGIVVVGAGVAKTDLRLFRRLRPHGVYLRQIEPEGGFAVLLEEVKRRAGVGSLSPHPAKDGLDGFSHWYIDGGAAEATSTQTPNSTLTQISYAALEPVRRALLERTQAAIESGSMGPERLRSLLAQLRPEDIRLTSDAGDRRAAILNHFQLSLLTEGSGTQIFSTTFVQWAARECLRRAEPETVLLRYAARQQQQPMNVMLSGSTVSAVDPEGSLVDADMGAYYTWLNLRRLPGADRMRFLVWFEGHAEALAIGPGLPGGTASDSVLDMHGVLKLLA